MIHCIRTPARCVLLATMVVACSACARGPEPPAIPAPVPAAVDRDATGADTWPVEVVDGLGRAVTVARRPGRIVSLTPSNTELLFAVGAGPQVVGRTSLDDHPPEARRVESVGGMTPGTINLESVVALRPGLILATGGVQEPIVGPIGRLGLTVVALDARDFEGVARNIRTVGRLTGHAAEADRLAAQFLDRVAAVERRVTSRVAPRPRVLFLVNEDPMMTAGPGTFVGRMIEVAGGINVFGDVTTSYPRPSEEEILARAPEVILASFGAMNPGGPDDEVRRRRLRSRPGWDRLPAVRDGRIAFVDEDLVTRPGPRLVDGLEAMADTLGGDPAAGGEGIAGEEPTPR